MRRRIEAIAGSQQDSMLGGCLAKRAGAHIVIVNGTATEMDGLANYVLRGKIGEILPRIVAEAEGTVGA